MDEQPKKPVMKPRIMKTTFMVTSMRSTVYIHNYEDLGKAFDELFKALPMHYGLRIQVRGLNCYKDDHAKMVLEQWIKKQEEKDGEKAGSEVAEVSSENKDGEVK